MKSIADVMLQIEAALADAERFGASRDVRVAITHLETAQLWLLKAAKEIKPEPQKEPQPEIVITDFCDVEPLLSAPWYIRLAAGCF